MADKEHTVFLLDSSVPSSAYKYVFDTLAAKLLKGLKTDFVTVATFHSGTTNHASADTGKFKGIDVLLDFERVSFESLRKVQNRLCSADILNATPSEESADIVQTVLFASTLFAPTKRKIFTRNIVLVTLLDPLVLTKSAENIISIPKFYADFLINFNVVISTSDQVQISGESVLQQLINVFPKGQVFSAAEALGLLDVHPPIRKTRPVAAYMGDMRFGSNFAKVISDETYHCDTDDLCVSFRIELYPAAKSDISFLDSHEYVVDTQNNIVKLERNTTNFVWEKNFQGGQQTEAPRASDPDKKFDKVTVDTDSLTPAFKFSNYDLIALDDDLMQATKLPLFSSFDIFSFIPVSKIPYELLTGETFYIVPEKPSSVKNTLSFQAFIEALYVRNNAALCRLVRKLEKEIEIGAAFPVKIKCDIGYTNCFVFVRLPYKEDEKIGRFPPLKAEDESQSENDDKKAAAIALLMDDFISDKTYESDDDLNEDLAETRNNPIIENFKVTMKSSENSKLALPPKHTSSNPLLCSSPSAQRYQTYMRKILLKSLFVDDWVQHFDNPNFIKENLRDLEQFTNFFNLQNCLAINSGARTGDWLLKLNEKSLTKSKRLSKELGAGYMRKAETKKSKPNKNSTTFYQRGNYGADEGTYDEIPEFDF